MRAGALKQRVSIYDKGTITRNGVGEELPAYDDLVATAWAAVEPLSGREFLEASQVQAQVTTRIRIRYRDGIRPEMQVVHGADRYDVTAVLDQRGEGRELHLMCQRIIR